MPSDVERGTQADSHRYLTKPVNIDEVVDAESWHVSCLGGHVMAHRRHLTREPTMTTQGDQQDDRPIRVDRATGSMTRSDRRGRAPMPASIRSGLVAVLLSPFYLSVHSAGQVSI